MRLSLSHRHGLYACVAILFLTGIVWAFSHYVVHFDRVEPLLLKIHGAATFAFLLLIGGLAAKHAIVAWRAGTNRASGIAIGVMSGVLIVSGYLLYYAGDEEFRAVVSWSHLVVGVVFGVYLIRHIWTGRRQRMVRNGRDERIVTLRVAGGGGRDRRSG